MKHINSGIAGYQISSTLHEEVALNFSKMGVRLPASFVNGGFTAARSFRSALPKIELK